MNYTLGYKHSNKEGNVSSHVPSYPTTAGPDYSTIVETQERKSKTAFVNMITFIKEEWKHKLKQFWKWKFQEFEQELQDQALWT